MRDMTAFSAHVMNQFDNKYENVVEFHDLMMDASHGIYTKYSKEETNKIIRNGADRIFGINWEHATPMKRRQAYRMHSKEWASLVEDVIADRMVSGIDATNGSFLDELVDDRNLAEGDVNEFYVEDSSILTVSKFAGNHHDVVRQALKPGVAFRIETSWYTIKTYTDFDLFRKGKVDFAGMVDKMYAAIEKRRYEALYVAFKALPASLPTDMILETNVSKDTKSAIIEQCELVKSVTGKEICLMGSKLALNQLQGTVDYNVWSDAMKDEQNQKGVLGNWEGYMCAAIPRINAQGTRTSITDNKTILIVPIDPEFKPIKRVNEGDVMYYESGTNGEKKDMTIDAEIAYIEGTGVAIDELFGAIKITG